MKTYSVALAAGYRSNGAPRFGSSAEQAHAEEMKDWLYQNFSHRITRELEGFGLYTMQLTEEEAARLEKQSNILYVESAVAHKVTYIQDKVGWGLAVACGRNDDRYKYQADGTGVTIYIVDTGVADIAEFEGRRSSGYDSTGGTGIVESHGTAVASVAAGSQVGVAKQANIVDVKVGDTENLDSSDIIAGLNWIITNHTDEPAVVNMSFGSYTFLTAMSDAIASLQAENVVCVAAAGNDAALANTLYPANYTNVICVGAIQEDLDLAWFSNYGARVDILAPGRYVDVMDPNNSITTGSGTSLACPYVAGAVACLMTNLSALTQAQARELVLDQAQVDLSIHSEGTTTQDVILTNMTRVWFGNTGQVGNLSPFKSYTLKPYTDDGNTKTYLTEQTVDVVSIKSTATRIGLAVEQYYGVDFNVATATADDEVQSSRYILEPVPLTIEGFDPLFDVEEPELRINRVVYPDVDVSSGEDSNEDDEVQSSRYILEPVPLTIEGFDPLFDVEEPELGINRVVYPDVDVSSGEDSNEDEYAPEILISISMDTTFTSGTFRIVTSALPTNFEVKDYITIQGYIGRVERIGPTYNSGQKVYTTEGRIIPEFTNEFVSLYYINYGDGDKHSVKDIAYSAAEQAGISLNFEVEDVYIQEYETTGRFTRVLETLADMVCGQLIQTSVGFSIVNKLTSIGEFSVEAVDIISITQTVEGDILDTIVALYEELRDLYIQLARLIEELEALKEPEEPEEEEAGDEVDLRVIYSEPMDTLNFEFWNVNNDNGRQPIDKSFVVEAAPWERESWLPTIDEATGKISENNPNNPGFEYYQVSYDAKTGKNTGVFSIVFAEILVPFTPPSNASGIYFIHSTSSRNIIGYSEEETAGWKAAHWVNRPYYDEANDDWVSRYYFVFNCDVPAFMTCDDDDACYSISAEVRYIPTIRTPFEFSGYISYAMWPIIDSSIPALPVPLGMLAPDGSMYSLDGALVDEISDLVDLPTGSAISTNSMCIVDENGALAGFYNGVEIKSLLFEHCGVLSDINPYQFLLGNSSTGSLVGYTLETAASFLQWPGLDTEGNEYEQTQEDIIFMYKEELPTALGVDYSEFDPENPDSWRPTLIFEAENTYDADLKEYESRKAELEAEIAIVNSKINCIQRRLASYGAYTVESDESDESDEKSTEEIIRAAADAYIALEDEEERQDGLNIKNKASILELAEAVKVANQEMVSHAASWPTSVVSTDCSFVYNNSLPRPGHSLVLGSVAMAGVDFYSKECGIIESVSLSLSNGNCTVNVTAVNNRAEL